MAAAASQSFPPDPLTFSYFIANASNVILILFVCLCIATIFSTIVLLLLLKIFETISDILLERLGDDVEEGRISDNRERLQTYDTITTSK